MGGGRGYVFGCHPRFRVGIIERVPIHRHIGRENESINVVSGDGDLTLSERNLRYSCYCVDFLPVRNALETLDGPDGEPLIGVDAAGDRGEGESCHGDQVILE